MFTMSLGFPNEIENWSVIDILHIKHILCLPQVRTWISNVFCDRWFFDCWYWWNCWLSLFKVSWYWWNCWLSLFKVSFYNIDLIETMLFGPKLKSLTTKIYTLWLWISVQWDLNKPESCNSKLAIKSQIKKSLLI